MSETTGEAQGRRVEREPFVPVTELMERGRVRMSYTTGSWRIGTKKWVPSGVERSSTPCRRSKMTARSPPSTATRSCTSAPPAPRRGRIAHAHRCTSTPGAPTRPLLGLLSISPPGAAPSPPPPLRRWPPCLLRSTQPALPPATQAGAVRGPGAVRLSHRLQLPHGELRKASAIAGIAEGSAEQGGQIERRLHLRSAGAPAGRGASVECAGAGGAPSAP